MGCGIFRANRKVLPKRKDVNGDEIDRVVDLAVAQPVFPDVGIGDGYRDLRLHQTDRGGQIGLAHLPAQQHLVADHERRDGLWKLLREPDTGCDLIRALLAIAAQPDSLDHLQPHLGGEFRHLIQTAVNRIGADAVGYLDELGEIFEICSAEMWVVGESGVCSPRNGAYDTHWSLALGSIGARTSEI